ncbi:MAG: hypothetical protein RLZZ546_220 [Bacteroidota bacterium]
MRIKFFLFASLLAFATLSFQSCTKDPIETIVDSSLPIGAFTSARSGSIVAQSDTGSKGTATLGQDTKGTYFLKLGSDFQTVLATGTVSLYLSTSAMFKADPGKGNPDLKLVGIIAKNGETYFKLSSAPDSKFTHMILWCGTAGVPFGNANLK